MKKLLITGATGYIGHKLLLDLLKSEPETRFVIPIRAESAEAFAKKKDLFLNSTQNSDRVEVIHSDLDGLTEVLRAHQQDITGIVHSAAITAFNVSEELANKVNRDASLKLFAWAESCPRLEKLVYVSTVYTSGLTAGTVSEELTTAKPVFANHYERSKWEVEEQLRTRFAKLPWSVARVATILCDDSSGTVTQQNAIHNTLKLFYYGLISLIPGKQETPVYLVEGDFVTSALKKVYTNGDHKSVYHVCHDIRHAISLQDFIDLAFEEFGKDESFKARRLMKPLLTDETAFSTLVKSLQNFGGTVLNQGLSSVAPFGQQLYIAKDIKNEELGKLLGGKPNPDMPGLIRKSVQYLMKTKFAKAQRSEFQ